MKVIEKIVGILAIVILIPCAILIIVIIGSSIFGKTFKNVLTDEPTSEIVQTISQEETLPPEESSIEETTAGGPAADDFMSEPSKPQETLPADAIPYSEPQTTQSF